MHATRVANIPALVHATCWKMGQVGYATPGERAAAAAVWNKYGHAGRAAVAEFRRLVPGSKTTRPGRLINKWGPRGSTATKKGCGPPYAIPNAIAKEADAIYDEGYVDSDGEERRYEGAKHALKKNAALRRLLAPYGVSAKTVERALRRINPRYNFRKEKITVKLTEGQKRKRREVAGVRALEPLDVVKGTTFIDEGCFSGANLQEHVFTARPADTCQHAHHLKPRTADANPPRLHFAVAVNYSRGPLHLGFLTGTRCFLGRRYMVRAHHSPLSALPPPPPAMPQTRPRAFAAHPTRCCCCRCSTQ